MNLNNWWPWHKTTNGHAALYVSHEHGDTAAAPEPCTIAPAPAPAPAPAVGRPEDDLAQVLSPSQVACFLECSAKWWYKYGLDLPEHRSSALAIGSAFHAAVTHNFGQKVDSQEDLPADLVRECFVADFEAQEYVVAEKESHEDLRDTGAALIGAYMEQVAPGIQPAHVEQEVSGEIAGVKVRGRLDIIDVDGRIIDAKTASKKPSGISPNYRFQVATYATLHPDAKGSVRLDTVTKTKTIQVIQQSFRIGDKDLLQIERMYPLAQEAMRSGYYVPNRNSFLCSRKYCPFWQQCEQDFGGEVDAV